MDVVSGASLVAEMDARIGREPENKLAFTATTG